MTISMAKLLAFPMGCKGNAIFRNCPDASKPEEKRAGTAAGNGGLNPFGGKEIFPVRERANHIKPAAA